MRPENAHRSHMLRQWVGLLCGELARLGPGAAGERASTLDPRIAAFERLVEAHYREGWQVADYAGTLGVSATHLNRLLRKAKGMSVFDAVEARRMREARRLLAYTVLSVEAIGYRLGFRDPAHFSRRFSIATGTAPSRYRTRVEAGLGGSGRGNRDAGRARSARQDSRGTGQGARSALGA